MKRYEPILQDHKHQFSTSDRFFAVMDDFTDGEFVRFEDVQALAKECLPSVIGPYNANPALVAKLQALIEAKP